MHIRRTPYQALAAIALSSLTFFVITVFTLINLGVDQLLQHLESRPQVTAFFQNDATQEDIDNLKKKIENTGLVKQVVYVSKEQALDIYRQQNQDNPLLLEMVTADILPASLEVSTNNVDDLGQIASIMQSETKVEEVVYQKDIINALKKWTNGIRIGGLTLSAIFLMTSIITITIIIGLKIAARKEEINTLSLLGATSWYIKAPFILEGIIYGVLGSIFGWGMAYTGLLYLTPNLAAFLQDIPLLPVSTVVMFEVLGIQMVLGIFVGWLSALIATRRYGK